MKTQMSAGQIEQYQLNGFIHHPGFLNPDELAELKDAVLATVKQMGKQKVAAGGVEMIEDESYGTDVFTQRLNLWRISDTVKSYIQCPALGKLVCQLEGIDGVRIWHDQALIKEPYGNPTSWHLDDPIWSFYSHHAISIWIALEDATLENGCLYFVPGSHKIAEFDNGEMRNTMPELFRTQPQFTNVDPVAVPMKAGDCSFHNGLTAHGAGANMTRGRRVAMMCGYMPIGSTFNGQQNILSNEYFNSLDIGDPMENEDWNPVVWEK